MIDIKLIRADKDAVEKKLKSKDPEIDLSQVVALDERTRVIKTNVEELKASRNHLSKEIGEKKRQKQDASALMQEVSGLGEKIAILDQELGILEQELIQKLAFLPNLPQGEIKVSSDPKGQCLHQNGRAKAFFLLSLQKSRGTQRAARIIRL